MRLRSRRTRPRRGGASLGGERAVSCLDLGHGVGGVLLGLNTRGIYRLCLQQKGTPKAEALCKSICCTCNYHPMQWACCKSRSVS